MKASFEIFDHTADAGIRARAASRSGLLEPASHALYAIIGELVPCGGTGELAFDLTGGDRPALLRGYLAELLILLERDQRIVTSVDVTGRLASPSFQALRKQIFFGNTGVADVA